jgi:N4-gp56 family major capsid protein
MVNLAKSYSSKVDERFKLGSLTEAAVNKNFDWGSSHTLTVYSVDTAPMNDYHQYNVYTREITQVNETTTSVTSYFQSRFGNADELGNTKQDMILTRDRSFTFTIDNLSIQDAKGVMKVDNALKRQIDEVIIPEIDTYRLSVMSSVAIANGQTKVAAVTADNAYSYLLEAGKVFDENKVPTMGRIAFVTSTFNKFIKMSDQFIGASELGQWMLIKGQVGEIDGTRIVLVPSSYLPANHSFILCHPLTTIAAEKLEDYEIHENPPRINGVLCEGRLIYDAFISDNKKAGLYVHKTA